MSILPISFYERDDVIQISQDLLRKYLMTHINDAEVTGGMIVETEAYGGVPDRASHAYKGRRTNRTEVMYSNGGTCYIYTQNDSKIGIWAMQKFPGLNDRKRAHISNMGTFTIVQPRGFGAAEIPIFESFSIYAMASIAFLMSLQIQRAFLMRF